MACCLMAPSRYLNQGEWVIKLNSFSWTAVSKVHVVHINHVIMTYTLESSLPDSVLINLLRPSDAHMRQ